MKIFFLVCSFFAAVMQSGAQRDSTKYSKDFVFKEGVYVALADFKKCKPNLSPDNFSEFNQGMRYLQDDFFSNGKVFSRKGNSVNYPDSSGNIREVH